MVNLVQRGQNQRKGRATNNVNNFVNFVPALLKSIILDFCRNLFGKLSIFGFVRKGTSFEVPFLLPFMRLSSTPKEAST
ncbi:hypothetical protein Ferpe_0837 [Fervidobacterium pennivorans DSM 9078]|jgi:hypothetical protein|uniref:Uncharacterized protein n=1 Tax=Fervidobacterium pennivorans (strain DSM 9078 / Ven5) TaxID=771875 RepID=H9UBR0_FERPD|nr:hypothetical protein Ferpe_0837 [Fervidobacterium pennivorans DSM 9078]